MKEKIILFELNEVPWRVLDDFVTERPHSWLAQRLPAMSQYETHAEDTSLSPWITWPTLHRGVSDEQHTISDFGQDLAEIDAAYPPIWDTLVRHGVSTGVFGSLHTYPLPSNVREYAFYIPDVFAAGSDCFPHSIEPFQAFNLAMSRASARNVSTGLPWQKALRLLAALPELGLTANTMVDVGRQLVDERRRSWTKVRRRSYQGVLAFDIFLRQLERTQPAFSTFFTNHVASSMHRFWAARYPDDYESFDYGVEWVATYRDEIAWTMSKCDDMLQRLAQFVRRHEGYRLWITTSMGQAATEAHVVQTQVYLSDVDRFMSRLGFERSDWEVRPAMLPRVIVVLASARQREFERRMSTIQIADRGPLPYKALGDRVFRIHPGAIQNVTSEFCILDGQRIPFSELGFANVGIQDGAGQSAYHIPRGLLLIDDPRQSPTKGKRTQISTRDIAPMICRTFGIDPPAHMRGATI